MQATKPYYKSITLVFGALFSLLTYAESQGIFAVGTAAAAQDAVGAAQASVTGILAEGMKLAQIASGFLTLFGLRRAANQPAIRGTVAAFFIVFALPLLAPSSAAAQSDTTASVEAVNFAVNVESLASTPVTLATASIGVYDVAAPATNLACLAAPTPATRKVTFVIPLAGLTANPEVRARAYVSAGCTGLVSPASPNKATVPVGPGAPILR